MYAFSVATSDEGWVREFEEQRQGQSEEWYVSHMTHLNSAPTLPARPHPLSNTH